MIPLGMAGSSQVMVILKKEGNGVMTTGPGAREGGGNNRCTQHHIFCKQSERSSLPIVVSLA